jgi:uncharacterized protein (TIRG00374 family)
MSKIQINENAPGTTLDEVGANIRFEATASSLQRKLLFGLVFGVLVTATVTLRADLLKLAAVMDSFRWETVPVIIVFMFLAYIGRFVKWQMYMKVLGVSIGVKDSARIFFAGLSLTVTPGKSGEVLKAYLLKKQFDVDFSLSAPTLIAERLSGLLAAISLASIATYMTKGIIPHSYNFIILGLAVVVTVILGLNCCTLSLRLLECLRKISFLRNKVPLLIVMYNSACSLNKGMLFIRCNIVSALSWLAECAVLACILYGLELTVSFPFVMLVYTLASIAGGLSMLPGGLGVAEFSMVGLLGLIGLDNDVAIAATLLSRLVTLWLGVVLGTGILFANWSVFKLGH